MKCLKEARAALLESGSYSPESKALLRDVDTAMADSEGMVGAHTLKDYKHYLHVGVNAIECMNSSIERPIWNILDFGCNWGRVMRFLRCRFPQAEIIAADRIAAAVSFCHTQFGAQPWVTGEDFAHLDYPTSRFDLIWIGSVITHISEARTRDLICSAWNLLSKGGVLVFTTLGAGGMKRIDEGETNYGLSWASLHAARCAYESGEYFFNVDPKMMVEYGIAFVPKVKMFRIVCEETENSFSSCRFAERGWDKHQDVFTFTKP